MPGFAECGPDKTAGDCVLCAGVLSYYSLGVRQSLTVRDITVFWNTGRDTVAASLDPELGFGVRLSLSTQ